MMMRIFLMLMLIVSQTSCTHQPVEVYESKVGTFIHEWKRDFQIEDVQSATNYEKYLKGVEDLYVENELDYKFGEYLSSVRNLMELMAHTESMLPIRFKAEKRRKAYEGSIEFKAYKIEVLTETYEKLSKDRIEKLKNDLGGEFFSRLEDYFKKNMELNIGSEFGQKEV